MINQAVIFCGGKGTRLGLKTPKCLVRICGEPMLKHILMEFINQEVNKFHFCLGYYSENIIKYLNTLDIIYTYSLDPEEDCGTWAALQNAKDYLHNEFFVTYGDSLVLCHLEFMYYQFLESKQNSMMSVSNHCAKKSNFCINLNNQIELFTNQPNYVEHGMSIMSKTVLEQKLNIKNFSEFFKRSIGQKVHYANANYYQINTWEDYQYTNIELMKFKIRSNYNFLDRDGTINIEDPDIYHNMLFKPTNILSLLNNNNCIIVTNQPNKAKNKTTLEKINEMNKNAREYLINNGKNVLFTLSCIHRDVNLPEDEFTLLRYDCNCRKPKIGMLEQAAKRLHISKKSIFYGNTDADEECAANFCLKFIKIIEDHEEIKNLFHSHG